MDLTAEAVRQEGQPVTVPIRMKSWRDRIICETSDTGYEYSMRSASAGKWKES